MEEPVASVLSVFSGVNMDAAGYSETLENVYKSFTLKRKARNSYTFVPCVTLHTDDAGSINLPEVWFACATPIFNMQATDAS